MSRQTKKIEKLAELNKGNKKKGTQTFKNRNKKIKSRKNRPSKAEPIVSSAPTKGLAHCESCGATHSVNALYRNNGRCDRWLESGWCNGECRGKIVLSSLSA